MKSVKFPLVNGLIIVIAVGSYYFGRQTSPPTTLPTTTTNLSPIPTKSTTAKGLQIVPGQKTALTYELLQQLQQENKACDLVGQINTSDDKTNWINYSDSEISLRIPYSLFWGNNQYALLPTEEVQNQQDNSTTVYFGKLNTGVEGCGAARSFTLTRKPLTSLDKIERQAKKNFAEEFSRKTINGVEVLIYRDAAGALAANNAVFNSKSSTYFLSSPFEKLGTIINSLSIRR